MGPSWIYFRVKTHSIDLVTQMIGFLAQFLCKSNSILSAKTQWSVVWNRFGKFLLPRFSMVRIGTFWIWRERNCQRNFQFVNSETSNSISQSSLNFSAVQLPNLVPENAIMSSVSPSSSFSQISSNTLPATFSGYKQPYTLLEYLYLKDLFGDEFPISWRTIHGNDKLFEGGSLKNGLSFYRSDSALNRAISPTGSFYRSR